MVFTGVGQLKLYRTITLLELIPHGLSMYFVKLSDNDWTVEPEFDTQLVPDLVTLFISKSRH